MVVVAVLVVVEEEEEEKGEGRVSTIFRSLAGCLWTPRVIL